ncbi:uncharacterized protein RCO7_05579 [Rhynchosporium graminicola]|uniref:DUF7779 domain-containing protein n=1 Tax=Rhynchosporium graminicola TaxID=2792576 RepID=A0A1E1LKX4_9HELO|nr:uncharacterized protein RCO7_05579 [Rhynchosporium commune]
MAASPSSSYRTDMSYEMIQSSTTSTSLASVHFPCFGKLPSRNPNFCGRQEIMVAIDETLLPTADSQQNNNLNRLRTHSIHGLGGMGKTQIATEYAQSRKNCFDAVFWINAASSEKLDVSFCQIASTLDLLENANSQDPVVCRALVKGWLVDPVKTLRSRHDLSNTESRGNANWFLIFDNADKPDILRDYWPQDGQGSILVTSRDPVVSTGTYFGGSSTLLETFTVPEAVDLLSKLVPRNTAATSSQESYNVVTRLGCYPLAISSMAGVICRQSLTLQEFIHLYSKELLLGELHNVTYGISSGYDHNIGSTWALQNLQLSAGALLNVISLLDPDGIPEGILMQNPEVAVVIGFPQLPQTYFKQLVELTQSSVVERNSDTKELKMHRMVQEVARVKMTRTQNMLEQTFDAAVKLTSSVWPYVTVVAQHGYANYTRIDRWDQCSKMLPHILSLKYVFTTYDLVSSSKITCLRELLVLFSEVACPASSKEMASFALEIIDQSTEDFREIAAALHGTCEHLAFETNDPVTCLFHAQQALTISENVANETGKTGKHATALGEMGKACNRNQLYLKALEYYSKSRSLRESQAGYHKLALFTCLIGSGHSLWLLNRLDEASASIEEALKDRAEAFGSDDREGFRTGLALYALGNVRLSQGFHNESFSLHQRALRQYKATIGSTHHLVGDAYYKVGEHHMRFEEYDIAKLLFEKSLSVYNDQVYYLPEISRVNWHLSKTFRILGDIDAARKCRDKAEDLYKKVVTNDTGESSELTDYEFDFPICFWSK